MLRPLLDQLFDKRQGVFVGARADAFETGLLRPHLVAKPEGPQRSSESTIADSSRAEVIRSHAK